MCGWDSDNLLIDYNYNCSTLNTVIDRETYEKIRTSNWGMYKDRIAMFRFLKSIYIQEKDNGERMCFQSLFNPQGSFEKSDQF